MVPFRRARLLGRQYVQPESDCVELDSHYQVLGRTCPSRPFPRDYRH